MKTAITHLLNIPVTNLGNIEAMVEHIQESNSRVMMLAKKCSLDGKPARLEPPAKSSRGLRAGTRKRKARTV